MRVGEQRAAELGLLVEQHDAVAGARRGAGGGEARGPGADDGDFAMAMLVGVMVGVGIGRGDAEAGGAADRRLVEVLPGARRPDEGLVVEAGGEKRRQRAVDGHRVALQRRPGVLRFGAQALVDLDLRRAQIGRHAALAGVDRDQRVRLLRAERHRPARAVVFERAAHQVDAVGDQRGGERVAGNALIALAVEAEADGARTVDATALP